MLMVTLKSASDFAQHLPVNVRGVTGGIAVRMKRSVAVGRKTHTYCLYVLALIHAPGFGGKRSPVDIWN